jgi:O-6-methylguanine DNA methyltransferase
MEIIHLTHPNFGTYKIVIENDAIHSIQAANELSIKHSPTLSAIAINAKEQLMEYFNGDRTDFDLPLHLKATTFQTEVWNQLINIPYGQTVPYGEIAKIIYKPKASRAIGMACSKNPIQIVIPCHRVIGKSGKLTGYQEGITQKQRLLDLENGQQYLI